MESWELVAMWLLVVSGIAHGLMLFGINLPIAIGDLIGGMLVTNLIYFLVGLAAISVAYTAVKEM